MKRNIPKKFDPRTMTRGRDDPKIVYVSTLTIGESVSFPETGHILIGVKGNPNKEEIAAAIRHEKGHVGHSRTIPRVGIASLDHLTTARHELQSYSRERQEASAKDWNRVLPDRIRSFMGYLTWVSRPYQKLLKSSAKRILSPKKGGGNDKATCQAQADLAQWWIDEEPPPSKCRAIVVKKSAAQITRELDRGAGVARPQRIKPGIAYTDRGKQRLARRHHKGWRKVKFA